MAKKKEDAPGKKTKKRTREVVEAIAVALVLALVIRTFAFQAFKIPSSSMEDTLLIGDWLLVNKLSYGLHAPRPAMIEVFGVTVPFFTTELKRTWGEIERGDVAVFLPPHDRSKDFIKRIIALPGDVVEVRGNVVYINDERQNEPYAVLKGPFPPGSEAVSNYPATRIPEGHVFAMGDNRDRSFDSRYWGVVDMKDIKGRAFIIYWSWNHEKNWIRLGRIGMFID